MRVLEKQSSHVAKLRVLDTNIARSKNSDEPKRGIKNECKSVDSRTSKV